MATKPFLPMHAPKTRGAEESLCGHRRVTNEMRIFRGPRELWAERIECRNCRRLMETGAAR